MTRLLAATLPAGCARSDAGTSEPRKAMVCGRGVVDAPATAVLAAANDTVSPIDAVRANNRAGFTWLSFARHRSVSPAVGGSVLGR